MFINEDSKDRQGKFLSLMMMRALHFALKFLPKLIIPIEQLDTSLAWNKSTKSTSWWLLR